MSEDHQPFPKDFQTQRTRRELWAILIIAVVVIAASLAWRSIGHHPAAREAVWGHGSGAVPAGAPVSGLPAAAADHPMGRPAP